MDTITNARCDNCGSRYMQVKTLLRDNCSDIMELVFKVECAQCGQLLILVTHDKHAVVHERHFPLKEQYVFKGYDEHYDALALKRIQKALKTIHFYRIRYFLHVIREMIKDIFINIAKKD